MCDKAILENDGTLEFVSDCYKNQEMYNKEVVNYPHPLKLVPNCYKTQTMCDIAVNTHSVTIQFFLNAIRLKKCVIKELMGVLSI